MQGIRNFMSSFKENKSKNCADGHTVVIGDNYDCLQKLSNAVVMFDMIYIDPPYNTGNKFSYNDSRSSDDWLEFMRKRLSIARNILNEDGVIFISIDDNYLHELKIVCDTIFSKKNFLGVFITKQAVRSNAKHINTIHEYVIAYAKDKQLLDSFQIKRVNSPTDSSMIKDLSEKVKATFLLFGKEEAEKLLAKLIVDYMNERGITWLRNYSAVDENGEIFFPKDLSVPGKPADLTINEINLKLPALATRRWSSPQKITRLYNENKLHFKGNRPYEKHYLKDSFDNAPSILDFYSRQGTNDLNKLGLRGLFDTPKPVELIKYLIRISAHKKENAMILDFFAGSGTTGQAVMEINIEDKKNHTFYLIQLDEQISKETAQYGFATDKNIKPNVAQLMIYRLNMAKDKLKYNADFNVVKVESL